MLNSIDKQIEGLYKSYLAAVFVFVAALLRFVNRNTASQALEVNF